MQFSKSHWLKRARENKSSSDWHPTTCHDIEKIVDWLERKGYDVDFTRQASQAWVLPDNTVLIPSKAPAGRQLIYLLHEAGHVSIECSKPTKRFARGYGAPIAQHKNLDHWVDVLDEELEAWARGLKIADKLKIKIDEKRYNKLKARSIKTYALELFKWDIRAIRLRNA